MSAVVGEEARMTLEQRPGEVELAIQSPKSSRWGALRNRAERESEPVSTGLGAVAVVTEAYLT